MKQHNGAAEEPRRRTARRGQACGAPSVLRASHLHSPPGQRGIPEEEPDAYDMLDLLFCELEAGHEGEHTAGHQGFPQRYPGVVWASWSGDQSPTRMRTEWDCAAVDPEDGDEVCLLPTGHTGAHDWALTSSFGGGPPAPAAGYTCTGAVELTGDVLDAVRTHWGPAARGEVINPVRCMLQAGHDGKHYGTTRRLPVPYLGALWARWTPRQKPSALVTLPDCCAIDPTDRYTPCQLFNDHPGAHRWALAHPPLAAARQSPDEGNTDV